MKNPFQIGAQKVFSLIVDAEMFARFDSGAVHPVYSTFYLCKHAEWTGRLFVLEMLEEGEEGIGTHISIEHLAPAVLGEQVTITASLIEVTGRSIECVFEARVAERLIAKGKTGQKIINKARFDAYLATLQDEQA
ncbi:MAG: thioesterase family protein [Bacteroidia bacterium]